jgi:hypothetical protein
MAESRDESGATAFDLMVNRTLMATLPALLLAACGATGDDDSGNLPGTDAPSADATVDAAVDAPPEPMPAFRVAHISGDLAVDDNGIRADYRFNGVARVSSLTLSLYDPDDGAGDYCHVTMTPVFVGFVIRSTSFRQFKAVQLDLGAGPILTDDCGWDDAHMLARLATMSPAAVGWMQARFEEDRPYLDLYNGGGILPEDIAAQINPASVLGYAMDADGNARTGELAQPLPGTLVPGVYQY